MLAYALKQYALKQKWNRKTPTYVRLSLSIQSSSHLTNSLMTYVLRIQDVKKWTYKLKQHHIEQYIHTYIIMTRLLTYVLTLNKVTAWKQWVMTSRQIMIYVCIGILFLYIVFEIMMSYSILWRHEYMRTVIMTYESIFLSKCFSTYLQLRSHISSIGRQAGVTCDGGGIVTYVCIVCTYVCMYCCCVLRIVLLYVFMYVLYVSCVCILVTYVMPF